MKFLIRILIANLLFTFPLLADDLVNNTENAVHANLIHTPDQVRDRILNKTGDIGQKATELMDLMGSATHGFIPEVVEPSRLISTFVDYKAFAGLLLLSFQPRPDSLITNGALNDELVLCQVEVADAILSAHHFWDAEAQASQPPFVLRSGEIVWNGGLFQSLAQANHLSKEAVISTLLDSGFAMTESSCAIHAWPESDRQLVKNELKANFLAKQPTQ